MDNTIRIAINNKEIVFSVGALVWWLIVGLIAGLLANAIAGRRGTILGDIVLGIIGAFIGGFVLKLLGLYTDDTPGTAIPIGTIIAATIGALILVLIMRAFTGGRLSRRRL